MPKRLAGVIHGESDDIQHYNSSKLDLQNCDEEHPPNPVVSAPI
jgi:hypothetical protein